MMAGCAVGPNYRRPSVDAPEVTRGQIGPAEAASLADLPWWRVFEDPVLQELVREAVRQNYDLKTAIADVVLAMINFVTMVLLAITVFGVPLKGSFVTLAVATLIYVGSATALGLLISTFVRSQVAAIFGTAILTFLPASQFSGMINPVSSLEGFGAMIGAIFPTSHYLTIARGTFSKALGFYPLRLSFVLLLITVPVLLGVTGLLLQKQEK
jgi:ribosome-dependent ATPase